MKPLHLVVALAVIVAALLVMEGRQNESLRNFGRDLDAHNDSLILDGCQRGNLRTAYELANHEDGASRTKLAEAVLPITNCPATQERGQFVPLRKSVQDEYVRAVVEDRVWPIIGVNGQIARLRPLPSALQQP